MKKIIKKEQVWNGLGGFWDEEVTDITEEFKNYKMFNGEWDVKGIAEHLEEKYEVDFFRQSKVQITFIVFRKEPSKIYNPIDGDIVG